MKKKEWTRDKIFISELMSEIPLETLEWLESVDFRGFDRPMAGYITQQDATIYYSVEYLKNAKLEIIQENQQRFFNDNIKKQEE